MRPERHPARLILLPASVMVAGLIAGALLRHVAPVAPDLPLANTGSGSSAALGQESVLSRDLSSRPDRNASADLTFSRQQWSQLIRRPGAFEIPLHKASGGEVPIINDIPMIGRLFQTKHQGPDLSEHAAFFGWDEARTAEVKQLLFRLAGDLRNVRSEKVRLEYPGGGKVVLNYSPAAPQIADLLRQAETALDGIVGDGRRFMIVAGIDRWDVESDRISVAPAENGFHLVIGGGRKILIEGDPAGDLLADEFVPAIGPSAPPIDLKRLVVEARATSQDDP